MNRSHGWMALFSLTGLFLLAAVAREQSPVKEQDDTKTRVTFDTFDGVKLVGTLFKGSKGSESPVAILVHRFNSDRTKDGWQDLAKELQTKLNFAVLTFDLRGHGESTTVKDIFWTYQQNKGGLRNGYASKSKSSITTADFKSNYWPVLFNDLIAARKFMDDENDAQRCNSSAIVVIGAQEGAGLGIGWEVHEFERAVVVGGANALVTGVQRRVAGEDILAGIWLGPVARGHGGIAFKPADWFARPSASRLRDDAPQFFIYGKQDSNSATHIAGFLAAVKKPPEGNKGKTHSLDKELGLATSLPGQELLREAGLGVNGEIIKFLSAKDGALSKRGPVTWKAQNPGPMQFFPLSNFGYVPPG